MTAKSKSGYLPSLDGWRAIAILGVLIAHDVPWKFLGSGAASINGIGGYGVDLFFAISGFLITSRILEEERINGFFDIRRFYVRRLFRIQPAAMAYLGVIGCLMIFGVVHNHWYYWLGAMFMYENFIWHPATMPYSFFVGHFWSLAVEEHFYILLSFLLLFVRRLRLSVLGFAWIAFFVAAKIGTAKGLWDPFLTGRRTYWQIDYLIFASMLAIALQLPSVKAWVQRYWKPWVAFGVSIVVVILHRWSIHLRHRSMDVYSLEQWLLEVGLLSQIFFALWVMSTTLHPKSWTTRVLEFAPLRYIGRISYSLYLWHVLFFFRLEPATSITNPVLLALSARPTKFFVSFGVAMLSYYFIEKPLIRVGHHLAAPATEGRRDLVEEPATGVAR